MLDTPVNTLHQRRPLRRHPCEGGEQMTLDSITREECAAITEAKGEQHGTL